MPRATILTLLVATALGTAGAAVASERAAVEPASPSFVSEVGATGVATIGGTVAKILHDGHFVLTDGEGGTVTVDPESLRLEGLAPGQMITVTGRFDDGELEASHVIREDGSVVVQERGGDHDARALPRAAAAHHGRLRPHRRPLPARRGWKYRLVRRRLPHRPGCAGR